MFIIPQVLLNQLFLVVMVSLVGIPLFMYGIETILVRVFENHCNKIARMFYD